MRRVIGLIVLATLLLTACAGAAQEAPSRLQSAEGEPEMAGDEAGVETVAVEREVEAVAEGAASAEQPMESDEAADMAAADGDQGVDDASTTAAPWDRKIVKNATVKLEAEDVLSTHKRVTALANQYGGYVVESRTWYDADERAHALYSFAVPVDSFEQALNEVRDQGKVLDEQTSGRDVTDQYVDLEARIKNLEATADRIRSFLDEARTVEEALSVNQRLSQVEEQLERLKGQRNALEQRASFSTITVEIAPVILEGTTETVETMEWSPAETFTEATEVLMLLVQRIVDVGIWLGVLGLPVLAVIGVLLLVGRRLLPGRPPVQMQ